MAVLSLRLSSSIMALVLAAYATQSLASVILSNSIEAPYQNSGTAFSDQTTIKAVGVEMPDGSDYLFESFRVVLQGLAPSQATGRIFSDNGAGAPLTELHSLNSSFVDFGHDVYDFVSPSPITLQANEKYWFAISAGPGSHAFRWDRTDPAEEPSGIADFLGYSFSDDSGAAWGASSFFNAFELKAKLIPEPTALLLCSSAFLIVSFGLRRYCSR